MASDEKPKRSAGEQKSAEEQAAQEAKEGRMTAKEFCAFLTNGKHCGFVALFVILLISLFSTIVHIVPKAISLQIAWHNVYIVITISTGGLISATYFAYVAELLSEQIDVFRQQNVRLEKTVTGLQSSVENLQKNASEMKRNVEAFGKLSAAMEQQATENVAGLGDILKKTKAMHANMEKLNNRSMRSLCEKYAADLEMADGDFNLSRDEYQQWLDHLDESLKPPTYDEVMARKKPEDEQAVTSDDIAAIIDEMLPELDGELE